MQIGGGVTAGRDALFNEGGNQTVTMSAADVQQALDRIALDLQTHILTDKPDVPTIRGLLRDAAKLAPDMAQKLYQLWRDPLQVLGIFKADE